MRTITPVTGGPEFREQFRGDRPERCNEGLIAVCIPMYNECAVELALTLVSIKDMVANLPSKFDVKVCIIQDGFGKTSPTALAAFRRMFPDDAVEFPGADSQPQTMILQSAARISLADLRQKDILGDSLRRLEGKLTGYLDITLVIKKDNRKKHNSHDLFFRGFADHANAKYAFATDCGTMFHPECLREIVLTMEGDPRCVACTGRQRVMTKWQQPGCEREGLLGWALRVIQGYDYEASTVVFNGCFSLFGCLAVIPGPCGLFRLRRLLDPAVGEQGERLESPFEYYAAAAARAEESQDLLEGNVILAEDRVLTYAALYLANGRVIWAKRAIFYFQSETTLKSLMAQRRRWLNGTVASYIFVMNELGARKQWFYWSLQLVMLLIYLGIALGPALYTIGGVDALQYLIGREHTSFFCGLILLNILGCAGFSVRHHCVPFDPRFFAYVAFANAAAALVMLVALAANLSRENSWIQWTAVFYVFLPVLLNGMVPDVHALKIVCNPINFLIYMLFMPTMQGYFLTFAIARTFDLSWGNRGGVGEANQSLKIESQTLMVVQAILNLILIALCTCVFGEPTAFHKGMNYFVGALLLLPTGVITFFSAQQALGMYFFWFTIFVDVGLVLVANRWSGAVCRFLENSHYLNYLTPYVGHLAISTVERVFRFVQGHKVLFVLASIAGICAMKALWRCLCCCCINCFKCCRPKRPAHELALAIVDQS